MELGVSAHAPVHELPLHPHIPRHVVSTLSPRCGRVRHGRPYLCAGLPVHKVDHVGGRSLHRQEPVAPGPYNLLSVSGQARTPDAAFAMSGSGPTGKVPISKTVAPSADPGGTRAPSPPTFQPRHPAGTPSLRVLSGSPPAWVSVSAPHPLGRCRVRRSATGRLTASAPGR